MGFLRKRLAESPKFAFAPRPLGLRELVSWRWLDLSHWSGVAASMISALHPGRHHQLGLLLTERLRVARRRSRGFFADDLPIKNEAPGALAYPRQRAQALEFAHKILGLLERLFAFCRVCVTTVVEVRELRPSRRVDRLRGVLDGGWPRRDLSIRAVLHESDWQAIKVPSSASACWALLLVRRP